MACLNPSDVVLIDNIVPQKDDPSPREMLRKVFMTRVRLEAPRSSGSRAAAAHWARLQQDAADLAAEHNRRALLSLVPGRCAAGFSKKGISDRTSR